ncbi:hypothetical protein [Psychrobacter sp. DM8]|uniref:hypothetical protein n=1 Tax=Psychrobacter sp. DM8 TaxID=3440636 RepID=UPI003F4F6D4E
MNYNLKDFDLIKNSFINMENNTPLLYSKTIVHVLNEYEEIFSNTPFSNYELLNYKNLDPDYYPIDQANISEERVKLLVNRLVSINFQDIDTFAMFLRSDIERLFYFELEDYICPNCGSEGGGEVLLTRYEGYSPLAFLCLACSYSRFLRGGKPEGYVTFVPLTTEELKEYGYL